MIKVLYLFAGRRKDIEQQWKNGDAADTYFVGMNHLQQFDILAEYAENRLTDFLRKINFNLVNLPLIFKIRKYDVVFLGGALFIVFLAKVTFGFRRPNFFLYNTYLTNLYKRNSGWRKSVIKKTIESIDAIVCPSTAQRDFLLDCGFDKNKIYFVPNGIDVEFISRKQQELKSDKAEKYILAVGKDMGRDYKTLVSAVRDLDITLKIVAWPRNLKDVGELPKNVQVLSTSYLELLQLYKNAEFVVLPTKKEEHLDASDCSGQLSLLDAMASGKAIIASRRDTITDYLTDNQEGILVEPENPVELKKAIEKLIANPDLSAELGNKAIIRVKREFTTAIFAKNLAVIIKNLTAQK